MKVMTMFNALFKMEAYILFIVLAISAGTVMATCAALVFFGWMAAPVPGLLVACAIWARARYLR